MNNNLHLPSILGSGRVEKIELERAKELSIRHVLLDVLNLYNSGNLTAVLSSGANGNGQFDSASSAELYLASQRLIESLGEIGCEGVELIRNAGRSDLQNVISDSSVANIFLLGHGSYHSWVATDGAINWYKAGNMVEGHLKNGVFANLGCGAVHSFNFIPLGRYVVGSKGLLLGKSMELTTASEMSDLSRFKILKNR